MYSFKDSILHVRQESEEHEMTVDSNTLALSLNTIDFGKLKVRKTQP